MFHKRTTTASGKYKIAQMCNNKGGFCRIVKLYMCLEVLSFIRSWRDCNPALENLIARSHGTSLVVPFNPFPLSIPFLFLPLPLSPFLNGTI